MKKDTMIFDNFILIYNTCDFNNKKTFKINLYKRIISIVVLLVGIFAICMFYILPYRNVFTQTMVIFAISFSGCAAEAMWNDKMIKLNNYEVLQWFANLKKNNSRVFLVREEQNNYSFCIFDEKFNLKNKINIKRIFKKNYMIDEDDYSKILEKEYDFVSEKEEFDDNVVISLSNTCVIEFTN